MNEIFFFNILWNVSMFTDDGKQHIDICFVLKANTYTYTFRHLIHDDDDDQRQCSEKLLLLLLLLELNNNNEKKIIAEIWLMHNHSIAIIRNEQIYGFSPIVFGQKKKKSCPKVRQENAVCERERGQL